MYVRAHGCTGHENVCMCILAYCGDENLRMGHDCILKAEVLVCQGILNAWLGRTGLLDTWFPAGRPGNFGPQSLVVFFMVDI